MIKGEKYIKTKQMLWAGRKDLTLIGSKNDRGLPIYTQSIEENLFEPLTEENQKRFSAGDGGEINISSDGPAKMQALHSSSAIGVNVFQYWQKIDKINHIAHACGLCNKDNNYPTRLNFEEKFVIDKAFSIGPNIDVVIENSDKSQYKVYAIECKFSEAYVNSRHSKGISPKYLDLDYLWNDIPEIEKYSKSISPTDKDFTYLDSAQLVKHILGLKNKYGKKAFRLLYLWYDVHGEEGYKHKKEVEQFTNIVKKDDIKFSSITYQEVIKNIYENYYTDNKKYCDYISDRYL